jgi:hypothetical protein
MQISDLHRSSHDPISNAELISALVSDHESYLSEQPQITAPEAIIVSGDIIQGVPLGVSDYKSELEQQYVIAEQFLDELTRRFLGGDRSKIIIVPGNHDVDWNTAFSAFEPVQKLEMPKNIEAALHAEDSPYRWDWSTQTLYRIANKALYEARLEIFWSFFERFYTGAQGLLSVQPRGDINLFSLCNNRIGVAAFNSCEGNDCFAYHGRIRKDAIARSYLALNDSGYVFNLKMAVWHHNIEGSPYSTDYMDIDTVRGMIGRGFRLGLYGHQHRAQAVGQQCWLANQEKMAVISAGSLCAGAKDLPTGVYRQYNLLEIAPDFSGIRAHVRAMTVANVFSPALLPDFGGKSYIDLSWTPPRNIMGGTIDIDAARSQKIIEEAEVAAKTGNSKHAIDLLQELPLTAGSYQRALLLDAAQSEKDWPTVIRATNPPQTIDELLIRFNAFDQLGQADLAVKALDQYATTLELPHPISLELRQRIAAKERINK